MSLNHQFFRNRLYYFAGRAFDIVSTIDHPYVSPPIRLIDGHYRLNYLVKSGFKPYICIWDVNIPNVDRYRYELAIDTGIFSTRDNNLFIFNEKTLYPLQKPKLIDFTEIKRRIQLIFLRLGILNNDKFGTNLETLIAIYRKNIERSTEGTNFYQNLLFDFYSLLKLEELAELIKRFSAPYFGSRIVTEWIPFCIKETKEEVFGLPFLFKKGLFLKPCFRFVENQNEKIVAITNSNLRWIESALRERLILPSYEVFFWTLALANIKHFGNDYGFFERLHKVSSLFPTQIQLTKHNQDSNFIIQFAEDRSFACFQEKGNYVVRKNNTAKSSRISSISAIFCHMGMSMGDVIKDIFRGIIQSPLIIEMGKVYEYKSENK